MYHHRYHHTIMSDAILSVAGIELGNHYADARMSRLSAILFFAHTFLRSMACCKKEVTTILM